MANKTLHTRKETQRCHYSNQSNCHQGFAFPCVFRCFICVKSKARIICRNDNHGNTQGHFQKQIMCNQPFVMGNKKDPKGRDKHAVSRDIGTINHVRPVNVDSNLLGLAPESKCSMAETRDCWRYPRSCNSSHHQSRWKGFGDNWLQESFWPYNTDCSP